MGRKCCVPGCRSNYHDTSSYVSSFQFPKEECRKQLWIKKINRDNFAPTRTTVVCIKHFSDQFIIREDRAIRDDGSILVVAREKPKLTNDAYPSLFPNQPKYLSCEPPLKRKSPSERQKDLEQPDEEKFKNWCLEDCIPSFEFFKANYAEKVTDWLSKQEDNFILFFKIDCSGAPKISVSFKINKDLSVSIWHGTVQLNVKNFNFILEKGNKCDKWTKFDCLCNLLGKYRESEIPVSEKLNNALQVLIECKNDYDEGKTFYLDVILENISLLLSSKRSYSPNYLLFAAQFFFSYSSAYNFIRNSHILILPHPVYLKKLSSPLRGNSNVENSNHLSYLRRKTELLNSNEKIVSLLLDEIYVHPTISYKSGKIIGTAVDSVSEANTIQAFMITSVFSKNKDVIALVPVKNQTADILHTQTLKVLKVLKELNYTVLCMISDNNRINRNMFTKMCNGVLKYYIQNPVDPNKKIFFLFDTVHLIKCVRNNWLKQSTVDQTLYYPNPDDFSKINKANLKNLKDIYEKEKKNKVIKIAPKLSQKVLYPTSL